MNEKKKLKNGVPQNGMKPKCLLMSVDKHKLKMKMVK